MSNEILDRVRPLLSAIRESAAEAVRQRRVPAETIRELQATGVFTLLQPKRYGGFEHSPADLFALLSSSYAPTGTLTEDEGGYRLTGRWSFASGSDHCQWVPLGTLCPGKNGARALAIYGRGEFGVPIDEGMY